MYEMLMTILCAFLVSSILFFAYRREPVSNGSHLPPGRMGLPFLGESIEFFLTMWKGRPESFVQERISRYSSETFRTSVLGHPTTIMYGPAGNKFLFANEGKVVGAWWLNQVDVLLTISKSEKFLAKNMAYSLFKPEGLQKHLGAIDRMAKLHFKTKWEGQQQVTAHPLVENYTFSLGCEMFMSIKDDKTIQSLQTPMTAIKQGLASVPINLPWTKFGKAVRASKLIIERLRPILRERIASHLYSNDDNHDDLLSHILSTSNESGEQYDEDQIVLFLKGFLYGAHDTTGATISLVINYLAENEDIYNKVLQEQQDIAASKAPGEFLNLDDIRKMSYSWNVAREAMRLFPPSPITYKVATDDFIHDGYSIPKGSKIQLNTVSSHRDPRFFPEPYKFDPSRFEDGGPQPYTYSPFGGGPRICPGTDLARVMILVFIHNVIIRFRWEKVHANEAYFYTGTPKPLYGLPVYLHAHTS